jgi:hypothetical protein
MKFFVPRESIPETPFPIGTVFKRMNREHMGTVIDYLTTIDSAGNPVKFRYVVAFDASYQLITDYDVLHTTIARALNKPGP